VGGVQLNLRNGEEVRNAFDRILEGVTRARGAEHFNGVSVQPMIDFGDGYELIIGSSVDPQFGPVLLFGTGGSLVEVFKDRSLGLPPLTTTLARRMVEQTKIYKALLGVRGRPPVDIDALLDLLVRFSQLAAEQPWIAEIDINPLLASPTHVLALDARVVLHPPETKEEDLPVPAVRPYPVQYIADWTAEDGTDFHIRPVRPEDEPKMAAFHGTLSERTVQLRYFTPLNLRQRVAHERLSQIVFVDYDREMVLVAETHNPKSGENEIYGVARLSRSYDKHSARFGIIISDRYQGIGMGKELLLRLIKIGRAENVDLISGSVLKENKNMLNLAEQLGFEVVSEDDHVVEVALNLN